MLTLKDFTFDCQAGLYRNLAIPLQEESGTHYGATGIQHPLLNGVVRCKTDDGAIQSVVDKVAQHFSNLNLPYSWWVVTEEAPASLRERLERKGLQYFGSCPVMVRQLDLEIVRSPSSSEEVKQIEDQASFEAGTEILAKAFQISQEALKNFTSMMYPAKNFKHVLAYQDGKPVATGSISFSTEGAYICNDSSSEGNNCTEDVALKLVQLAKENGATRVAVISAPNEVEAYKQAGFEEMGAFDIYYTL